MSAIDAYRNEYGGFEILQLAQYKEFGPQYIIKSFKNLTNFEFWQYFKVLVSIGKHFIA